MKYIIPGYVEIERNGERTLVTSKQLPCKAKSIFSSTSFRVISFYFNIEFDSISDKVFCKCKKSYRHDCYYQHNRQDFRCAKFHKYTSTNAQLVATEMSALESLRSFDRHQYTKNRCRPQFVTRWRNLYKTGFAINN